MKYLKILLLILIPVITYAQPNRDTVRIKMKGRSVIVIDQAELDSLNSVDDTIPTLPVPTGPTETKLTFSFSLAGEATCGAGLYRNGRLIRTFFSNEFLDAGTHNYEYNPYDDNLDTITDLTGCHVEVTQSNATYNWDGIAGNTSLENSGDNIHQGYQQIRGIAVTATKIFYNKGYSEGTIPQNYFTTDAIQTRYRMFPTEKGKGNQVTTDMCTDDNYVYWAGGDPFARRYGRIYRFADFVFATKVSDNSEVTFSSGVGYQSALSDGHYYRSAINFNSDSLYPITGCAVQQSGSLLFIARTSKVDVVNKTTGAFVTSNAVDAGRIVTYGNSYVFVADGTTVKKYSVSGGGVMMLSSTITGFDDALALTINGDTLVIVDGGTSQLVKAFSAATGAAYWEFGTEGGYYKSSASANNKFYFTDDSTTYGAGIDYASDGSFWLVDGGNYRLIHFSSAMNYIEHIQYIPNSYNVYCDPKNPTRVFVNYLEFEVDYTKDLTSTNGSWTFVANWYNDPILLRNYNQYFSIRPIQFSNGRTYSLIVDNFGITYSGNRRFQLVELVGDSIRPTGKYFPQAAGYIHWDGDVYYMPVRALGKPMVYTKKKLTGYDGSNNPIYTDSTLATINYTLNDPFYSGGASTLRPGERLTGNKMILFESSGSYTGFHLGLLKWGDSSLLWRTARSTHESYLGQYPSDDAYDIGNRVEYAGIVALAEPYGENIFWGYHGEFWKNSQTNKWNHVYNNGSTIGQFGVVGPDLQGVSNAQMAGNVSSASLVKVGDTLYLWHNDEGWHSGVSRWSIKNLSSISIDTVTPSLSLVAIDTTRTNLMEGLPFNQVVTNGTAGWYRTPTAESYVSAYTDYFSVATSLKSYNVFTSPDIFIQFTNKYYQNATIYRQFPTTNQTTWSLTGQLTYDGNSPAVDQVKIDTTGSGGTFLDIVDYNNKVILRLRVKYSDASKTFIDYYANNQLLWRDSSFTSNLTSKYWQDFSVTNTAGTLAISYAGHSISGLSTLDATANKSRPDKIRVYMWSKANNAARKLGLKDLIFDK